MLRLLLVEARSHPFAVVRAAELRRWVDSGAYTAVLAGSYPRRTEQDETTLNEAAQEAARSYAESFRQSQDAVSRLVREAATLAGSVRDWMGSAFGSQPQRGEEA